MFNKVFAVILGFVMFSATSPSENAPLQLALLKYSGGGDWYANPTALPNLARFCNKNLGTNFEKDYATVEAGSVDIFNYPWIHMTGHGNVVFSAADIENMRNYLLAGGFLHIDDNYGMDKFVRITMKEVFPELDFEELPFSHEIYNKPYTFKDGVPKIHKHDDKPSQGLGLIYEGRLICFYSYESDLGDGWEDQEVHKDPEELRIQALRMGANIIQYAFEQ